MSFSIVTCSNCGKDFLKDNRHINENKKLGHNLYCSTQCQSSFKNKQVELMCENFPCQNKFKRMLSQWSFRNFCSQSCAAIFNNKARVSSNRIQARNIFNNKRLIKIINYCQYCGNRCLSKHNYCSNKCWAKAHTISKEELINQIKLLSLKLGRTPTRRECKNSSSCQKYFGSWNNALIAARLTPHRSLNQRMYKRRQCFAKDGHICNSVSELIIDNWLYKNNIDHQKETPYPKGKFTADWSLSNNIFVEYFGLAHDSRRYDEEIKKKQQICKDSKITLFEIYSKDLFPKNRLEEVLK